MRKTNSLTSQRRLPARDRLTHFCWGGDSITEFSDEAALRRIFGDTNVKQDRIDIGEGETLPGTVLFPKDLPVTSIIYVFLTVVFAGSGRQRIRFGFAGD